MKMKRMTILIRTLAICLCAILTLSTPLCLGSCAAKQVPLLTLQEESISVNHYRIMQSRTKGIYMGSGYDVANAALFLASNGADYITGQTLNVSGGFLI